ncbi:MAG: alpha-L-rhamnosidase C-terminal domain-containing protein [Spirochaetota bacterium]
MQNVPLNQQVAWHARYAWSETIGGPGLEVRRLRRRFQLASLPERAIVHVTAESRYILFVNGRRVGRGPLKGTVAEHHFETFDVAPFLRVGDNVVAAEVRWFGVDRPVSEIHGYRAGFLLQGPEELGVDTPEGWLVLDDRAVAPDRTSWFANSSQFLVHFERVDLARMPRDWQEVAYDDSEWMPASDAGSAWSSDAFGVARSPVLIPRSVDQLTEERRAFSNAPTDGWRLDAGEGGELVLSAGELTTGYPRFRFSGGEGRTVELIYAECALFPADEATPPRERIGAPDGPWTKGVRDDIAHGGVAGYRDTLVLDGTDVVYEPFHWRTFWFIGVRVSAGPTAVTLEQADYAYTTYPAELAASFSCDRPEYETIWSMCWRTLRLCSHETFEDCPYYEQLHYLADARIEALTHLYLTGDTSYVRRSIELFRNSLRPDGLVESRPPSDDPQIIPYFALIWVLMLEDLWDYAGNREREFLRTCLFAMDGTLVYFRDRLREDGFVGHVDHWNMVDNGPGWDRGEPPAVLAGESTYLSSLFVLAARTGARLHREIGAPDDAWRWDRAAGRVGDAVREAAWDEERGIFLEGPGRHDDPPSQHAQLMPVLAGIATDHQAGRVAERLAADDTLIATKLMQSFYLARALERLGRYDRVHEVVWEPWRRMIDLHLSTCAEYLPGRSDCHAWSSWPALDFVRSVLGIRPSAPGFDGVTVAPQTAGLARAEGHVTTPAGRVEVRWERSDRTVRLRVTAPDGVPVTVVLGGERTEFPSGGEIEVEQG